MIKAYRIQDDEIPKRARCPKHRYNTKEKPFSFKGSQYVFWVYGDVISYLITRHPTHLKKIWFLMDLK